MENLNEFSHIEQAAMEQSPAHDTDVRHNFVSASDFIDKIEHAAEEIGHAVDVAAHVVGHATEDVGEATAEGAEAVTPETEITVVAAGGVVADAVLSHKHYQLIGSIDKECSVEELIDLRRNVVKANSRVK